ncbi:unnamed protein product [Acanthosepion pharaonis]|uniref:Uncharacterized protein n=1 Tax=Acanthosepion pharaonis TaxID=158019 RepID=A0A812CMB9_ACAPH|nr:unnamed protein product [Sepia pharaonis]
MSLHIHLSFCLLLVWSWIKFFSSEKKLGIPANPCLSIRDEHAVRPPIGEVTNVLLDRSTDRRLVTAHVSDNFGVALASIIVDCLLDSGDEHVGPNCRRTNVVRLSSGSKLVLVITRLPLPPNVHDHGSLEPKSGHHFRRLLPDAKRSYYHCSALIFHPGKW